MTNGTRERRWRLPPVRPPRRHRSPSVVALLVLLAVVTVSCIPDFGEPVGTLRREALATGNGQRYRYFETGSSTVVYVGAPWDDDTAQEVFWSTNSAYVADLRACATWYTTARSSVSSLGRPYPAQPGIALRVAPSASHSTGVRAVTITERAVFTLSPLAIDFARFDVDLRDTGDLTNPSTRVATFDASAVVGDFTVEDMTPDDTMVTPPWHVCAQTFGNRLSFKIWTGDDAEPPWDDPVHVFEATLPDDWRYAGYAGSVVGALHANQSMTFGALSSVPTCLTPEMFETPDCRRPTTTTAPEMPAP